MSTFANFVVSLGKDGRISSQGQLSKVLAQDTVLASEFEAEKEIIEEAAFEVPQPQSQKVAGESQGKLIVDEEVSLGHIGWPAGERHALGCITHN